MQHLGLDGAGPVPGVVHVYVDVATLVPSANKSPSLGV